MAIKTWEYELADIIKAPANKVSKKRTYTTGVVEAVDDKNYKISTAQGQVILTNKNSQNVLEETLVEGDTVIILGSYLNGQQPAIIGKHRDKEFSGGNGIEVEDGVISVKVDGDTLLFDDSGTMYADLDRKQDKLTAGANITISEDNVISATGGGAGLTAGKGVSITKNVVSTKIDNDTLKFNSAGTMYADLSGKQDVLTAGTGIDITGTTISATGEFAAGQIGSELTDMNNITTCKFYGIYRNLSQVSHVPSNVPTSTAYYSLLVAPSHNNVNRIVQVLVFEPPNTSTSSAMWFRTRMNETTPTWTSWYQINTSTTEDMPDWNNTIDLWTLYGEE